MTNEAWADLLAGPLVREALARGYCHAKNSHKVLDADLLEACAEELLAHLRESGTLEQLRAEMLKEACQIFEEEYSNHAEPLIGVVRGLTAIRAKAKLLAKGEK